MTAIPAGIPDTTARRIRRAVTSVVFVIAGLAFAFGFGNGWALGLQLGVSGWIAPLVAPAVDLSVVVLLASIQFLRANGFGGRLVGPRLLLVFCGLVTVALNTARPILAGKIGRACFDGIAPSLLIFWSEAGPGLLMLLHHTDETEDDGGTVPDDTSIGTTAVPAMQDRPVVPSDLVAAAQRADEAYRKAHGRGITRDVLRRELRVSNAVAGKLVRRVRDLSVANEPRP